MRGWLLRLYRMLRSGASEHELDDEMRHHVEMETEALVRSGLEPREARRRALMAFGGQDRWREETRAARGTVWLEDALRDARFALRGLARNPAFTFSALVALSLGVGATTAIYSVVRGVVLAPLPFPRPDQLVTVWMSNPAQGIAEDIASWPNFEDWRSRSATVDPMVVVRNRRWTLTGNDADPEEVVGAAVSRGFFEMLGAPLALGRTFRDEEAEGDPAPVVVLSHELWVRRFGSDPGIVGATIRLNDEAWEVVGVTQAGRGYPRIAELWTPFSFGPALEPYRESRGTLWLPVVGRLADGVDLQAAQAEVDEIARGLREEYPTANEGVGITLEPLQETLIGDVRTPLLVLLGAVGLVLLIAVVNVANLLLARGVARGRELALRLTLGAERGRVVRQALAESAVLGGIGGLIGAALAAGGVAVLLRLAPAGLPRVDEIAVEPGLLLVAIGIALGASLLFGLVPALHAGSVHLAGQVSEGGGRGGSSGRLARVRGAFVTGQFALALVLLVGAGLLLRSFANLRGVDPGFQPAGVLTATLSLPSSRYPGGDAARNFTDEVIPALEALPGVERVGAVSTLFITALPNMSPVVIESRPELDTTSQSDPVVRDAASEGFLDAAGMRLVAGRGFTPADGPDATPVAVVNEAFVRRFLSGRAAPGERFSWTGRGEGAEWITVVGVAADARRAGLDAPVRPSAFVPHAQSPSGRFDLLVRTSGDPLALTQSLRTTIGRIDPMLALTRVRALDQAMSETLSARRFVVVLLGVFAAAALVLAAVGIYGVMAYVVGQRTREIGIRVALGAERGAVLGGVLREGLLHAGIGLVLGGVGAVALSRYVRSQLFGLDATDPATFALAALVLVLVAAAASAIPARRAAAIDPMVALREE